jgi:hypothetical protein
MLPNTNPATRSGGPGHPAIFTFCFNLVLQDVVCILSLVSNLTNVKITNADMYSNATDVLWTISNISYNVTQMRK